MYPKVRINKSTIFHNESVEGQTIEEKVRRLVSNNEPIGDSGVQTIYTERGNGVMPEYDIRADKMEIAREAMDKSTGDRIARRSEKMNPKEKEKEDDKIEPTPATE